MLTKSLLSGKLYNKFCFDNEKASKYKILKLKRRNPFCETQCLKPSICSQSFNWIKIQTCKSQPGPKSPGYLSMSIILIIYCSDFVRNTKFTWSVRALVSLPSLLSSLVSKVRHITCSWLPNQMISLILIFGFLCRYPDDLRNIVQPCATIIVAITNHINNDIFYGIVKTICSSGISMTLD